MGGLVNRAVNAVAGKEKNILSLANSVLKQKKTKKDHDDDDKGTERLKYTFFFYITHPSRQKKGKLRNAN